MVLPLSDTNIEVYFQIKRELLSFFIRKIFKEFKEYIDNKDLVFVGSILHNRLGIITRNDFKDLDLSINIGETGDNILFKLKDFLLDLNYSEFENRFSFNVKFNNKFTYKDYGNGYKRASFIVDDIFGVDVFRGNHDKTNPIKVELFPNTYTYFLGYEWMLYEIYVIYEQMLTSNIDVERKKHKKEKFEQKINMCLKYINLNNINNDKLLLKLKKWKRI